MQLHERTLPVQKARTELSALVADWSEANDLTIAETVQALLMVALDFQKYAIRDERHPGEPGKKGDEA